MKCEFLAVLLGEFVCLHVRVRACVSCACVWQCVWQGTSSSVCSSVYVCVCRSRDYWVHAYVNNVCMYVLTVPSSKVSKVSKAAA